MPRTVRPQQAAGPVKQLVKLFLFLGSLFYFNTLLTYANVVSTPWIELVPRISMELVLALALVATYRSLGLRLPSGVKTLVAVVVLCASLLRYIDLTALGVMGRDFNVHADTPHVHRVVGMFWEALPLSTSFLLTAVVVVAT